LPYLKAATKRAVYQRDLGRCVVCGSTEKLEYHHLLQVHRGIQKNNLENEPRYKNVKIGTDDISNIILLCQKCHYLHTFWINPMWFGKRRKTESVQLKEGLSRQMRRRLQQEKIKAEKRKAEEQKMEPSYEEIWNYIPKIKRLFPNSSYEELITKQQEVVMKLDKYVTMLNNNT